MGHSLMMDEAMRSDIMSLYKKIGVISGQMESTVVRTDRRLDHLEKNLEARVKKLEHQMTRALLELGDSAENVGAVLHKIAMDEE